LSMSESMPVSTTSTTTTCFYPTPPNPQSPVPGPRLSISLSAPFRLFLTAFKLYSPIHPQSPPTPLACDMRDIYPTPTPTESIPHRSVCTQSPEYQNCSHAPPPAVPDALTITVIIIPPNNPPIPHLHLNAPTLPASKPRSHK
jgi:hypothetical protein